MALVVWLSVRRSSKRMEAGRILRRPIVRRISPQRGWRIEPSASRVRLWEQRRWLLLLLLWLREVVIGIEGYQLFGAFERRCEREEISSSGEIERIGGHE